MIRLKVSNFDLANHAVWGMMVKQAEMKEKRLVLKCGRAIQNYVLACGLLIRHAIVYTALSYFF